MWKGRSRLPSRASAALLALASLLAAPGALAACGPVPADYPVVGDARLDLGNNGSVNGLPFPAYGGTVNNVLDPGPPPSVQNVPLSFASLYPPAFPANPSTTNFSGSPVPAGDYNRVTVNSASLFTGGVYHIRELHIAANAIAILSPGSYYIDRITLQNNSRIIAGSGTPATIYLGTELTSSGGSQRVVGSFLITSLRVFMYGGSRFALGNGARFYGVLFAPDPAARVEMGNNATLIGAMITAGSAKIGNNAVVSYTPAVRTLVAQVTTCPPGGTGPDHFAIGHGGTGVTCQPETVTLTAHDSSHNAVSFSGAVNLSTSTGRGDWSLVSGSGTLANGALNDGAATYTFNSESSVTLALRHTQAGAVNIGAAYGSVVEAPTEDPVLSFADSGFRFIDGAGLELIATQTAGQDSPAYYLQAIRTDTSTGACVGVFGAGQTVNLELASQCNDPTTCAGRQVAFTNAASTTPLAANPDTGVTAWTTRAVTFLNDGSSRAAFGFSYADAGRIRLHARYNLPLEDGSPSGNYMVGASNPFVVKPAGFLLSGIRRSADAFPNPGAADAAGPAFMAAGDPFSATVTAVAADGTTPLPNYGRETTPEGVRLTAALVAPAGGNLPALGNPDGFGSFAAGSASGTAFSWDEVGIITLTPEVADADYLGAGNASGPVSGNVGRFHPHHFGLSASALTNRAALACSPPSSFSYMGEGMSAAFTLTAQNAGGGTTANYAGAFAKLDPTAPATLGLGARDGSTDLSGRLDLGVSTGAWTGGSAAISASVALGRRSAPDTPDGPFEALKIGVAPVDGDGVRLAAAALDLDVDGDTVNDHASLGQTKARYGRLRLDSAYGSELLPLPVPASVEYWNGAVFVTNGDDGCTRLSASDFALSGFTGNLGPGETGVTPATVEFAAGRGQLKLTAPGNGNNGSALLSVDLEAAGRAWLLGRWDAVDEGGDGDLYDDDPAAKVGFGLYRKGDEFIYLRENF